MSEQQPHKKQFTAEDLQRYHAGTMSDRERHALERAALDDPFLADALEGYALAPAAADDVSGLQQRLHERIRKGRLVPLQQRNRWQMGLGIAALLLLLLGAGWLVYVTSLQPGREIALQPEKQTEKAPAESAAVPRQMKDSIAVPEVPASDAAAANQPARKEKRTPAQKNEEATAFSTADEEAPAERMLLQTAPAAPPIGADSLNTAPAARLQRTKEAPVNVFEGRVVDAQNNPVPYASVQAGKKAVVTQTDSSGRFTITGTDSVLDATVNAPGFAPNRLLLRTREKEQTIVLQEGKAALNEVVVAGYGKRSKQARKADAARQWGELEPEGGWPGFDAYIEENLREPEALKKGGAVRLTFDVDSAGNPVNIQVQQSLCQPCDEEAIRLLKEGPKWKKKKGKKGSVHIHFPAGGE